jgi:hypothetical protein
LSLKSAPYILSYNPYLKIVRLAARRHCSRPKICFSGSFNFLAWRLFPMRGAHQQRQPEGAPRRHTVFFRSKTTAERRIRTRAMCVCSYFAGSAIAQAGGLARRRHKSLQFFQIPARPGPTPNPDLIKMLGSCMFSHPVLPEIQDSCTFGPAIIRYFKEGTRPFHFCELDLIDHRCPKVTAICKF